MTGCVGVALVERLRDSSGEALLLREPLLLSSDVAVPDAVELMLGRVKVTGSVIVRSMILVCDSESDAVKRVAVKANVLVVETVTAVSVADNEAVVVVDSLLVEVILDVEEAVRVDVVESLPVTVVSSLSDVDNDVVVLMLSVRVNEPEYVIRAVFVSASVFVVDPLRWVAVKVHVSC